MNFRRNIVGIGCLLILAVLFTVTSLVDFNPQDVSAQIESVADTVDTVSIMVKTSVDNHIPDRVVTEFTLGKTASMHKTALEKKFLQNPFLLTVVPFRSAPMDSDRTTKVIDWKIYLIYKAKSEHTFALSITLTREDTFVMNQLIFAHMFDDDIFDDTFLNLILFMNTKQHNAHMFTQDDSTILIN